MEIKECLGFVRPERSELALNGVYQNVLYLSIILKNLAVQESENVW